MIGGWMGYPPSWMRLVVDAAGEGQVSWPAVAWDRRQYRRRLGRAQ